MSGPRGRAIRSSNGRFPPKSGIGAAVDQNSVGNITALIDKPIWERVQHQVSKASPNYGCSQIRDRPIDERGLAMDVEIVKFDHRNPMTRERSQHVFMREVFAMLFRPMIGPEIIRILPECFRATFAKKASCSGAERFRKCWFVR